MTLYIDPSGGMAGDMFCAALISLGVPSPYLIEKMESAGLMLGDISIEAQTAYDESTQLRINLKHEHGHLDEDHARDYLLRVFQRFSLEKAYHQLGLDMLEVLIDAERQAHKTDPSLDKEPHKNASAHGDRVHLHEAQDIIIDITGAVFGLQYLGIDPVIKMFLPVSVGGGVVHFSHGQLPVPAPATRYILESYQIPWKIGPLNTEMCTPTGASILAAMKAGITTAVDFQAKVGYSRGTKDLQAPPLKLFIEK